MKKHLLSLAAMSAAVLPFAARAEDPATAVAALTSLSGTTTAFGPPLFGLAVVSTGIMIGLAWIKKGRGAAK